MINGDNAAMPTTGNQFSSSGLSARDYIAIAAMQGFLSNPHEVFVDHKYAETAEMAYNMADAMIERSAR